MSIDQNQPELPTTIKAPDTLHEGFENAPPSAAEKAVLDQKKAEIRDRNDLRSPEKTDKKKFPVGARIGVIAAGALVAGGAIVGPNIINGLNQESSDNPDEGMGPNTTSETVDTWVGINQPALDSLGISSEALASGDELAKELLNEHLTEWINYGATPENSVIADDPTTTDLDAFIAKICEESDQAFIDSLLIEGWESVPALRDWVNAVKATHAATLRIYFSTDDPKITPENVHPFIMKEEYSSVPSFTTNPDGSISLETISVGYDNRDDNTVGENPNYIVKGIGEYRNTVWTFVIEDGKAKVSNIIPK